MTDKHTLMAAFEQFLETVPEEEKGVAEIGFTQLFTELAALRTEVKTESRQFNRTLEDYRRLLELLEREQQQYENRLKGYDRQRLKPLLLDLVDIRDRLAAGIEALQSLRPHWLTRLVCKRRRRLFEAVQKGHRLTLERFDQLLASWVVEPIAAVGQPFDPALMRAVEVVHLPKAKDGEVLAEILPGWRWRGEVLRLAEVKVNKRLKSS